jgi:hypothetical protein
VLVAFSVTPIGTGEAVGEAVAQAVRVVQDSGLPNRTDAMFTTIEGDWVGDRGGDADARASRAPSPVTAAWPAPSGASWFFVALARHAREHGGGELLRWDGEGEASDYLYARSRELGPRPDGLGVWAQDGTDIAFLLEYDTGTEHLPQLVGKLTVPAAAMPPGGWEGRPAPVAGYSMPLPGSVSGCHGDVPSICQ